ncbi:hypothetical protein F5X68DRAFT_207202 [Plectosphaerella plurivora]|uniref:HMG box domain-containing protein n=1 Tax=Plectosphaerella plurivora TaxID=936078 RepID=A0A9P9A8L0_9PEZI|nr:hypothetical protein F5X68DRAFT_207202 [Plectosphaerella plurivora]
MAPQSSIPPALPPSVEEAYRRKCVQLKQRTNEVEEENDATRIRLARIRRQIEKMRVERAFLLEQLTRRTSANVEDSEGSPSPPPTPKDKPLRTKRGHRKPSMMADLEASLKSNSSFVNASLNTLSPSSEAFSHSQGGPHGTNGVSKPPKKPADAFELYREEARPALLKKRDEQDADAEAEAEGEDEANVEEELSQGWKDLPDAEREVFQSKHDDLVAEYEKDLAAYDAAKQTQAASPEKDAENTEAPSKDDGKDDKETKETTDATDDKDDKDDKKESEEKAKDEGKSEPESKDKDPAKEDEEMKDSDKVEEKVEKAEAAAAAQDEDVEMGDTDAPAAAEEKKSSEEAD